MAKQKRKAKPPHPPSSVTAPPRPSIPAATASASSPDLISSEKVSPLVTPESDEAGGSGSSPPLSWAERAHGGSCSLKKCGSPFQLDSGELCVKIPNKVIEDSKPLWKSFVVGQFYHKAPSFGKIRAIVNLIWSKWHHDITVTKLDSPNTFLFKIPNVSSRQRVLREGIWSIDGVTMFVAEWTPGVQPSKPALRTAPVWIELRNVPYEFYNPPALSRIASIVGHPICLHKETIQMTNFEVAKVFTEIDLLKPLPESVCAQFESGETRRIAVSCPHLPPICSICAEAGHSSKHCSTALSLCVVCNKANHSEEICPWRKGKEKSKEPEVEPPKLQKTKCWSKKKISGIAPTPTPEEPKLTTPVSAPINTVSQERLISADVDVAKVAVNSVLAEVDSQIQLVENTEEKPPDDDQDGFTPVITKKQKKKNRAKNLNGPIYAGRFSFRT